MKRTIGLGRVAGIPIRLNWSVLLILVLIAAGLAGSVLPAGAPGTSTGLAWAVAVPAALGFLASLLAHELAHALVARRRGVKVESITLWLLGGMTHLDGEMPDAGTELRVATAGPLASGACAAVFLGTAAGVTAAGGPAVVITALAWLGFVNGLLAVFNLLPGAPLDGGRVLCALRRRVHGDRIRAEREAARAGRILGYVIVGVGFAELMLLVRADGLWLMLIGWFIAGAATAEEITGTARAAARDAHVRDLMTPDPACGTTWLGIGAFVGDVALLSRQEVFPVVELTGRPVGLVTLDLLARTPPARARDPLGEITIPLPPGYVDHPGDPALPLLTRTPLAGSLVAVVVTGGRVCGMVTTEDIGRFVQRSRLRRAVPARPAVPAPKPGTDPAHHKGGDPYGIP